MNQPKTLPANPAAQRGLTLIEALVAVIILGLGVLALLGVQLSTLAETQNSTRRAHAIRIMEDLSERIKSNSGGLKQLEKYTLDDWVKNKDDTDLPSAGTDCRTAACNDESLAAWDLREWAIAALDSLPAGTELQTFLSTAEDVASNRRQLGIMVGWPLRENEGLAPGEETKKIERFNVAAGTIECPDNKLCHLIYVQP